MAFKFDMDYVMQLAEDNMFGLGNWGLCTQCGAEHSSVEDDADGYECDECGAHAVCGAGNIAMGF